MNRRALLALGLLSPVAAHSAKWPKEATVKWSKYKFTGGDEGIALAEVGLRSDGVVVWRREVGRTTKVEYEGYREPWE